MKDSKQCSRHAQYFPTESTEVPLSGFGLQSAARDGLQGMCRRCMNVRNNLGHNAGHNSSDNPLNFLIRKMLGDKGVRPSGKHVSVKDKYYEGITFDGVTLAEFKEKWRARTSIERSERVLVLGANGIAPEVSTMIVTTMGGTRVVERVHDQLKRAVTIAVQDEGGRVGYEQATTTGRIDVVAWFGNDLFLYEIKTADTAYACFKQAIGQLLVYFFETNRAAVRLVIAGTAETDKATEDSLAILRNNGIPVVYQKFTMAMAATTKG